MDSNTASNLLQTLQTKIIAGQRQLSAVRAQTQAQEREKRRNELTLKEIESLPSSVTTYKAIGKMFLQVEQKDVTKELRSNISEADEVVKGLEKKQKFLEREITDCNNSLKDILHYSKQT
ncbi:hypothetical protein H4R35_003323 [Dimargaris xerosporica]|nr:hypothetical protein H4R35_003323 [Dimargaris xerosporica]